MEKKNKLKFCFYCGSLLPRYKEGETKYCVYCGVKLPYKIIVGKNPVDT